MALLELKNCTKRIIYGICFVPWKVINQVGPESQCRQYHQKVKNNCIDQVILFNGNFREAYNSCSCNIRMQLNLGVISTAEDSLVLSQPLSWKVDHDCRQRETCFLYQKWMLSNRYLQTKTIILDGKCYLYTLVYHFVYRILRWQDFSDNKTKFKQHVKYCFW